MNSYIADQLKERNVIANLAELLAGARSKNVQVMYGPFHAF